MSSPLEIEASTARTIRVGGRELVYFGGCSYLGLTHHPEVLDALVDGTRRFGASSAASRATSGNTVEHAALEGELGEWLAAGDRSRAALLALDGYTANLAAAEALADACAFAIVDRASHASVHDALRAAPIERVEVDAARIGDELERRQADPRPFALASDGVFPAAGRAFDLASAIRRAPPSLAAIWIDDCHGLGVLGAHGRGLCESLGLDDRRVVVTATLAKAFGCAGGVIFGRRELIDRARRARAWLGTTPIAPGQAAAARAALRIVRREPERRARALRHADRLRAALRELADERPQIALDAGELRFPVLAIALDSRGAMERLQRGLADDGAWVPLVDYFDGPRGGYLRAAVNAEHADDDVALLIDGLRRRLGGR